MHPSRFFTFLLCFAVPGFALSEVKPVEMLLSSKSLEPGTSVELRFADPIVHGEQVGHEANPSPLVIHPAVKGRFVWLSSRSGTFTPEEPWPLSTTLQLALRDGLSNAAGKPLQLEFRETIQTPALEMKGWHAPQYFDSHNAPVSPRFALLFNADLDSAIASRFVKYVAESGEEIAALLRTPRVQSDASFPASESRDRSVLTWAERFHPGKTPDGVRANQLIVVPVRPLSAGKWKLIVAAGLPSIEDHVRLLQKVEIAVGEVRSFTVSANAANALHAGRQIVLSFSKPLSEELNGAKLERWVSVSPAPFGMKTHVEHMRIGISGAFELGMEYRVTVRAGLPGAEPVVLPRGFNDTLVFRPVAPQLGFERFSTHQLRAGHGRFHLLAVNVPRLRLTAKLFTPEVLPLAAQAYGHSAGAKLPPEGVAGRNIWQHEIEGTTEVDAQKEIAFDWNEILGAGKTGAVLLTAEQVNDSAHQGKRAGAQSLVQLTDLGLVWKRVPGETFVHVFSLTSQAGLAGVKLRALDEKNATVADTVTDRSGIARLKGNSAARLLAEHESDAHLVNLDDWENHISLSRVRMRFSDDEEDELSTLDDTQVFIFTDRGVYKPGETAHLKAIAGDSPSGAHSTPAKAQLRLRVTDPRGREILNKLATFSAAGSCSEEIALPAGKLGSYVVIFERSGENGSVRPCGRHSFEVQEYRPNPFEITIGGTRSGIGSMKLELPVSAKYYMGKPLSEARLNWSITARDETFAPEGFADFDFCHTIHDYRLNRLLDRVSQFDDQGDATLDERGATICSAIIPLNSKAPQPRSGRLLCEITDLDQHTVSESATFTVHSSDFYLGVRRLPEVLHEGDALPIEVIAVRTDGTPCTDPISARLRLTRIEWQTNRVATAGDATEYRSEPEYQLVAETTVTTHKVIKQQNRWAVEEGPSFEPLLAGKAGQYLLEVVTRDNAGRDVITTASFHVHGEGETDWDYRNPFQVDVVADKQEYIAGETATLLIKTPISGEALVTVEREKVLRSFVTKLSGNAPSIEVPIERSDAPNVFISIMLLRGAADSPRKVKAPEYRIGYCELKVSRPEAKLSVYVRPGAASYQPGEEVTVECEVLDFKGTAVGGAEVTLYAVDEGVLSLTGYKTPDALAFFNRPRPLSVRTALTLPTLLDEDPEERDFVNKGYLIGGGGDTGADRMRKNFITCAYWNATLGTDAAGRCFAKFTAPDSLTRYRVMAVVQTAGNQFGNGEGAFEVNKPVMLEPALPRFANLGDKLALRAVLHNTTGLAGEVEVALALDATAHAAKSTHRLQLAAHGSAAVDFPVEFIKTGKAHWQWSARFVSADGKSTFRDSVQTELKVGYPAPLLREIRVKEVLPGETNLLERIDPQLLAGTGAVRVSITNSRAIELQEALRQLLHYPYGCVEQTTSSTLPWLSLRDLRGALPSLQKTDAEIAYAIQRGADRLLSMQTSSGGLSYWPGNSEPMLWGSAYGGLGLVLAKEQGAEVPAEDLARLLKYISEQLRGTGQTHDHYGLAPRCLALYTLALAGHPEPAYHEILFQKKESLSGENRALLALAIQASHGPASMIEKLLAIDQAPAAQDAWFSCGSRQTAMRLLAWSRHDRKAPAVETLAAELMGGRRAGHWWTTQGNAWSLLAVGEYLKRVEGANIAATGNVSWNKTQTPFVLQDRAQVFATAFEIDAEAALQPLRLTNAGKGRLFAEVEVEAHPQSFVQPKQDRGYAIERTYSRVENDGRITDLLEPRVGDRVLVTLSIEVRQRAEYLALEDPLPAIFEPLNPVFKSQETRAPDITARDWISHHRELRDDRALFFADWIEPGRYTLRYLARVCAAGTAIAPSAKVEEMYHPERFGLSGSGQVSSRPLE